MDRHLLSGMKLTLEKIARTYAADFLAGVDPTGTITSNYGIRDAGKTQAEQNRRKWTGVAGGVVGGGVLIPGLVGGVGGAVTGAAKGGVRGAMRGAVEGAQKPFKQVFHAVRAQGGLNRMARQGGTLTEAQKDSLNYLSGSNNAGWMNLAGRLGLGRQVARGAQEQVGRGLQEGLSGIGLSAAVGSGSALMQYNKGVTLGNRLTPEERMKVVGK